MCEALFVKNAPIRSRSTELLTAGSLSIVLEGVDDEPQTMREDSIDGDMEEYSDSPEVGQFRNDESQNSSRKGSQKGSRRASKKETEYKIKQFKSEAAERLNELERLLEEHDQIIRELKRSESTGRLHVDHRQERGSGFASAPNPASPVNMTPPSTPYHKDDVTDLTEFSPGKIVIFN